MFGLFKKKEAPQARESSQSDAFKRLAAQFSNVEMDILAVTGPSGFGARRMEDSQLWEASIGLTAWMEEDSPEIHREETGLVALADDTLRGYLRQRVPPDFIIKFRARPSLEGGRFLLMDLPQPAFDPDLKAILEEQKKPQSVYVEDLGTFVLNRQVGWYEAELSWLDGTVRLDFDNGTDEAMKAAQATARALLADAQSWDTRIRTFAARQLTQLANQWAQDGVEEGEEPQEITPEEFARRMELDAIQVDDQGGFTFWFEDGEMFWGHSIRVSGTLEGGPDDAQMEG